MLPCTIWVRRSVRNPTPTNKKTAASLMAYSGYCYEKYFLNIDVSHSKSSTAVDLYFLINKRFPALNTMINIADISNVCPPLVIILFLLYSFYYLYICLCSIVFHLKYFTFPLLLHLNLHSIRNVSRETLFQSQPLQMDHSIHLRLHLNLLL